MTDERIGGEDALLRAIEALPRGSGIVFRHYGLSLTERQRLFDRIRRAARRRRLILLLAGPESLAKAWGADGFHKRTAHRAGSLWSAPVHNRREILQAEQAGADVLFLSPVFPTRSHPGAKALGRAGFARLARQAKRPVIALGGMTAKRGRFLSRFSAYGWAAIDGLSA